MPSNAHAQFITQLEFVSQLIAIHGKLQTGKGRRYEQDAIHRAGVVMTVAAWESYIEEVVMEALDALERNAGIAVGTGATVVPAWARHAYSLRRAEIAENVKKFNTPNDVKVRDLLLGALEFNPWPDWHWHSGPRQWNERDMRDRLNDWLQVRHSVAHGSALPANISWLQDSQNRPRLTLQLLKECKKFFEYVATQTDVGFRRWLVNHHGVPTPW